MPIDLPKPIADYVEANAGLDVDHVDQHVVGRAHDIIGMGCRPFLGSPLEFYRSRR